jgi:hypothetical protein
MNKLYILVDFNSNQVLTPVQYLPENWSNINGLDLMDEEKIKDLSWAGHDSFGWINIQSEDITEYNFDEMWMTSSKLNLKSLAANHRWEKENEILTINEKQIKLDERTKSSLTFKLPNLVEGEEITWKFLNGTYIISSEEFVELCNLTNSYIQSCFAVEYEFNSNVDSIQTAEDLVNLNTTLIWPNTTLA